MAKTNPTGIRIKQDKLEFVMKEENLKTVQQVVTFLVDRYYWSKQFTPNPVLERGKVFPPPAHELLVETKKMKIRRPAAVWQAMILECQSPEEYAEICQDILEAGNLTTKEINLLLKR